jgi:O-antigen/teichoic acid export membrane protein
MFALWLTGIGAICLIGMLWAKEFLILLTPKVFHAAAGVVPIIIMGNFFHGIYFFAVSPIFQFKKTKFLPFLTGAAAMVNIGLNLLFIPRFGIVGAAYATLLSFTFQAVLVYVIGRRLFDPKFELLKITFVIVLLSIVPISSLPVQVSIELEIVKMFYFFGFLAFVVCVFSSYTKPIMLDLCNRFKRII